MRKLLHVAWQELRYTLGQWTFYITLLGMPLIFAGLGAIPRINQAVQASPLAEVETVFNLPETITTPIGYVDQAGVIVEVPPDQAENFHAFPDEAAARIALDTGEISAYYVIPPDYVERGRLFHYSPDPQLFADTDNAVERLLDHNLLLTAAGAALTARIEDPMRLTVNGPPAPPIRFLPADVDMPRLLSALAVAGLFGYLLNLTGNLLLRALERESRTRMLEVLITSTTPTQLLVGKMTGLCALALLQAALTLLAGALVFGGNPDGSGPAQLPVPQLVAAVPYLLVGYIAYSGALAGLVGVMPRFRESTQLLSTLRLLALSPLIGLLFIVPAPHGAVAIGLTLFPLTSPLLMPARTLLGAVPLWQHALSLLLLAGWAGFSVWLATRLFRMNALLTGSSPNRRALLQALRG